MKITVEDLIEAQNSPEKMAKLEGGELKVEGYLDLSGVPPTERRDHKGNNPTARGIAKAAITAAFSALGFSFADGILAKIVSQRGPIQRVVIIGKTEISYVISDDEGNNAHGATMAEARADLMVKRTSKDLTQFKAWTLDKVVSKQDAIFAYRSITGACSLGTSHWLEQHKTPEKITVEDIIKLTLGAYGSDTFEKFFAVPAPEKP